MALKAYVVLFDGFADWEASFILPELNVNERFDVVYVGLTEPQVISRAGMSIHADITFERINIDNAGLLLLPGGTLWEQATAERAVCAVRNFVAKGIPVAAICGATIVPAKAGVLNDVRHTSNGPEYLPRFVPEYTGQQLYQNQPACTDGNIVTASGAAAIEFAYELIKLLNVYPANEAEQWFRLFKDGAVPTD